MSYDNARNQAVADAYKSVLARLLAAYKPGQPTVILLPGGMGSQLDRSPKPYSGGPISFKNWTVPWMSLDLLFNGAGLTLEIDGQAHDQGDHIIAPDGPMRFALLQAYDGTQAFFEDHGFNYAVFGYDWRRMIQEAALNLQSFLADFRTAVRAAHNEDPLPETTVLCHSQGGLVAKLFLHLPNTLGAAIGGVITIATPFYGTASQTQRFFQGQNPLNILHGADRIARIVGGLPGPYALMPMDLATWRVRHSQLNVPRYPVLDTSGTPADVYDIANLAKYPPWVSKDLIDDGRLIRLALDRDLPGALLAKFFHIRAVTTPTMGLFRWGDLPPNYVAGQSAPNYILDGGAPNGGMVDGDGTVPAFATAPAQNLAQQMTAPTRQGHGDLAENARVLSAVTTIIATGALPDAGALSALEALPDATYRAADRPKASSSEVNGFFSDIAAGRSSLNDPRLQRDDIARGVFREFVK